MTTNDDTETRSQSRIRPETVSVTAAAVPWWARGVAKMRANTFDRRLAVGAPVPPHSSLAAHATRLTSDAEREAVARTLRRMRHESGEDGAALSMRLPLHHHNIAAAQHLIDAITLRLHSPRPVAVLGMARLRVLLADGAGPLYRYGRGDLAGKLGAALAEL